MGACVPYPDEPTEEDRDAAFAEAHRLCGMCDEPTCDIDQCVCAPRPVRVGKLVFCSTACKAALTEIMREQGSEL